MSGPLGVCLHSGRTRPPVLRGFWRPMDGRLQGNGTLKRPRRILCAGALSLPNVFTLVYSDLLDLRRARSLGTLLDVELDDIVFGQALVAGSFDVIVMHEYILAAVFRRDETVTLCVVKPFHCASCHHEPFLLVLSVSVVRNCTAATQPRLCADPGFLGGERALGSDASVTRTHCCDHRPQIPPFRCFTACSKTEARIQRAQPQLVLRITDKSAPVKNFVSTLRRVFPV